ncbi:hypothetical protein [Streptomyces sp. NPDC058308]|uniref:hypothetical protein n=1 Tax=Streptomyces sp. NPDC058308 TaxID=3346440 RepID=UPI0036E477B1
MTAPIDHLLARARLIDAPIPISPAPSTSSASPPWIYSPIHRRGRDKQARDAACDLHTLCETVLTRAALDALTQDFLTHALPTEPDAARVLGCILQLGNVPDAARFWWQFAAGAGDHIASYCLALQHQSLGEDTAATWWMEQTPGATDLDEHLPATPDQIPDIHRPASLPTTLRILSRLRPSRRLRARQPLLAAVMDYVVSAIKYVDDDVELPLPAPEFVARIRALTAPGTLHPSDSTISDQDAAPLPARPRGGPARSVYGRLVLVEYICAPS